MAPTRDLVLTVDNGKLMLQTGGAPIKIEMYPTSDTTFLTVTPNLRIEVVKDAQGAVTHLLIRQGAAAQDMKATRK